MTLRKMGYRDMDKFRAIKKEQNKRYYQKTQLYPPRSWTVSEEELIFNEEFTDHQLSEIMKRSVRSIQVRRCKINKQVQVQEG